MMRLGTRSIIFGVHHWLFHPLAVALAFRRLEARWPTWREALCIAVHDWGYWGCGDMDGPEGVQHPRLGGQIAAALLGLDWGEWTVRHSGTYAELFGAQPSELYAADKLSVFEVPEWLYLGLARLSGELAEYRARAAAYHERTGRGCPVDASDREWFSWLRRYVSRRVFRHLVRDRVWTPACAYAAMAPYRAAAGSVGSWECAPSRRGGILVRWPARRREDGPDVGPAVEGDL
jgi:hypothetical protein